MTTWFYSRALQQRAELEGWGIFEGNSETKVQRIDSQDHPDGGQLDNDDQAIELAQLAGVPCDEAGVIHVTIEEEY